MTGCSPKEPSEPNVLLLQQLLFSSQEKSEERVDILPQICGVKGEGGRTDEVVIADDVLMNIRLVSLGKIAFPDLALATALPSDRS